MKQQLPVFCALLLGIVLAMPAAAGTAPETTQDCFEMPGSNVEVGQCLGDLLAVSDALVERAFQHAVREAEEAVRAYAMTKDGPKRLKDAQKEWREFREHHCGWIAAHPGSGAGNDFRACMIDMTQDRIRDLRGEPTDVSGN